MHSFFQTIKAIYSATFHSPTFLRSQYGSTDFKDNKSIQATWKEQSEVLLNHEQIVMDVTIESIF